MSGPLQPDFVTFDVKEREAFLSQNGNFTPSEREIFHRMAKMWSPEIPYQTVLGIVSSDSVNAKTDIEALVRKLKAARIGLIVTQIAEGARTPKCIILANPDDPYFYVKLVEEELMDVVFTITLPLPSEQSLAEKGVKIPPAVINDLSWEGLAMLHSQKENPDHLLFRVETKGPRFLITSQNVKRFVTVALAKMQQYLQNSNLLSLLAQIKGTSMIELKKQVETRDPSFWIQFTKMILEKQGEIKQNRKVVVDENFWSVSSFLFNFISRQVDELKKRKEAEEARLLDMRTIVEQIKVVSGITMRDEDFSELMVEYKNKYEKGFNDFKSDFEKQFLEAPDRKSLPVLVHLARFYIHQDNLYPFFLMLIEKVGKELFAVYVKSMEQYIKRPESEAGAMFFSRDAFESDIADQIRRIEPLLSELLQRPNLIAEAMIHNVRKKGEAKSSEDLKSLLTPFFHTDRIRFRDLAAIFGLNIVEIYKFAFLKLSVIRQMILKLTGKFESMRKKFDEFLEGSFIDEDSSAQTNSRRKRGEVDPGVDPGTARRKKSEAQSSRNPRESARERRERAAATEAAKTAAPTPAQVKKVERQYSVAEKDKAWQDFGKTIKK